MKFEMSDFVTFEEALKAYNEGNNIASYIDGESEGWYSPTSKYADTHEVSFKEILHGQWKIELRVEDKNLS